MANSYNSNKNQIIKYIDDGIIKLKDLTIDILRKLNGLKIISINSNEEAFPFGLPPFTRSVSWIVEKSLIQNIIKYKNNYNIKYIKLPKSELAQYDFVVKFEDNPLDFYINVKTSNIYAKDRYDDISKAKRLIDFLSKIDENPLIILTVKVEFIPNGIKFHPDKTILFNVAWLKDFKYNPVNRNLQTRTLQADKLVEKRLNREFIKILKSMIK